MPIFWEIVKMQAKVTLQYRWGLAITLLIQPLALLLNIVLFKNIFAFNHTNLIKGYSIDQMIWYFSAVSFVYCLIWNFTDLWLSDKILTGDLAVTFLRPVSLLSSELANALGQRIVAAICEFIPGIVLYSLIYFPKFLTLVSFLKFIFLVFMAFLLYYLFNFLLGLTTFAIKNNTSLIAIRIAIVSLCGGAIIPLEFYPVWANRILDFLPFKYIFYWPVQIFLNKATAQSLSLFGHTLLMQCMWIGILFILVRVFWGMATRKFCSAGG